MRRWLEADGERCLLVLGNAADPDLIEPCVPSVGRATVIITTNQQAMANLGTAVPVDVFTEQQAMDFLGDRTGLADAAGAAALAKEAGCLPLALAQAAAVIGGQHLSYAHYLGQLRRTPVAGLLARSRRAVPARDRRRDPARPGRHRRRQPVRCKCVAVLDVLAVPSPSGVPRALVRAAGEQGAVRD
jgi:hypothetical protein